MVLYSLAFVGGFDLAAQWMGWENVFSCEINPFGQRILKYYWPNAIHYDDITKTDFTVHRGGIDILTGGFPCQPFSLAGKRKGTEDDRHLWPRMLEVIRQVQPVWVVGENVYGLVNWDGGLVFDQVQSDLESEGYEVQPVILPACAVNAPHRRDRIWFIAHSKNNGCCRGDKQREKNSFRERSIYECKRKGRDEIWTEFERLGESGITTYPTSNAVTGQDRESIKDEGTGIAVNEQARGGQLTAVQHEGLDDISRSIADTSNKGLEGLFFRSRQNECTIRKERKPFDSTNSGKTNWSDFPTQSPLCSRNDGIPSRLDGITFPKWRNESIKAAGNAIVPQVAFEIFKVIEQMSKV